MKELYTSPEAKIVSFAAAENVALDPLNVGLNSGDLFTSTDGDGDSDF